MLRGIHLKSDTLARVIRNFQSDSAKDNQPINAVDTSDRHSNDSEYVKMLKGEAEMDIKYNLAASSANWSLLAGYLVVPGTFTSLQHSNEVENALQVNKTGKAILQAIQNPPLLIIACVFFAGGSIALLCLLRSSKIKHNYPWLINKIFMPASFNAAAGLLTTFVNIYTSRSGNWSVMAIVTAVVTGLTLVVFSFLLCIYKTKLIKIQKEDNSGQEN